VVGIDPDEIDVGDGDGQSDVLAARDDRSHRPWVSAASPGNGWRGAFMRPMEC